MSVKQLRVTWQVPWVGSPLAPYEYQGLKFRGSCCSLGPPGKVFFPGSGLTQTPSLTKGEGNQGHWVSSQLGLNLAPSLLGLHCPVSARILLSHFVKNPSTPDMWSRDLLYLIKFLILHPGCLVPLACLQGESCWAGLTRIPHLSPLLQSSTGPLTLALSVNPSILFLMKSWHPMRQWPQLRQHPAAHGPNLYMSEHAWPFSLQVSIVLVCLLACFCCSLLDSGLYHQMTKHRLSRNIPPSEPWAHLTCATFCKHLWLSQDTVTSSFDQKTKTNVTLGSTLSLPSVTSIMESVSFCQFKANALHAF